MRILFLSGICKTLEWSIFCTGLCKGLLCNWSFWSEVVGGCNVQWLYILPGRWMQCGQQEANEKMCKRNNLPIFFFFLPTNLSKDMVDKDMNYLSVYIFKVFHIIKLNLFLASSNFWTKSQLSYKKQVKTKFPEWCVQEFFTYNT